MAVSVGLAGLNKTPRRLPLSIVPQPLTAHPARSDCERALPRIGQPVNTLTSLGITVAGLRLAKQAKADARSHPGAKWAGWALAAAGIGSAVYHGPGGRLAPWLHDVTLLAPPVVLAIASESDRLAMVDPVPVQAITAALGIAGFIRAFFPGSQDGLSLTTAAALAGATWQRVTADKAPHDRRALLGAAATAAVGIGVFALSRTDGPLCRPKSIVQGHGIWHLLAAAATVIAARGMGLDQRTAAFT